MVTMKDVADRAGVSIATVSFVVNGTKHVASPTRARIETAMDELHYRRNVVARALASSRTRIIALLHPVLGQRLGGSVLGFIVAASNGARARGHDLVLWPVDDEEQMSHLIGGGLVDGALVMEVRMHDRRVETLLESGLPFALIGRTADESLPFVDVDFDATVELAMRHLAGLGHREIALVDANDQTGWVADMGPTVRTEAAYRRRMTASGRPPVIISTAPSAAGGIDAAQRLRAEAPQVTGIILMNEQAATGLVRGLRGTGVSVPEDVSIISMSSTIELADMVDPVLTVLQVPAAELGQLGVDALIDQLEGATTPQQRILLPCLLVPGESTAPVRHLEGTERVP